MVLKLGNGSEDSDTMIQWLIDCLEENCLWEAMPHSRGGPTTRTEVNSSGPLMGPQLQCLGTRTAKSYPSLSPRATF